MILGITPSFQNIIFKVKICVFLGGFSFLNRINSWCKFDTEKPLDGFWLDAKYFNMNKESYWHSQYFLVEFCDSRKNEVGENGIRSSARAVQISGFTDNYEQHTTTRFPYI